MKIQLYFPMRIGDQIVWLLNYINKLPVYATTLGLVSGDVTATILDAQNAVYGLESYRGAIENFPKAAHERLSDALNNETIPGNIVWMNLALPTPMPTAVLYGCLSRIFTYINDTIRKAAAYDKPIGTDLGTEAPATPAPAPNPDGPDFKLRFTDNGKLEVVWTKGVFDGVKLQFDLGAAGLQNDIDLRPHYTLNWMPALGATAIVKVRLIYIYKGEEFGSWSAWQNWTLTGV